MTQGSSRSQQFREFARLALQGGFSGNQIIQSARDVGIGLQRKTALGIIRELRSAAATPQPVPFAAPEEPFVPAQPVFRWGRLVQETDQWNRYDGPHAILFQAMGPDADRWTDYIIPPDDTDLTEANFVVPNDEDGSPRDDGTIPDYVTRGPVRPGESFRDAARRLGVDFERISRVVYTR